MLTDPSAIDLDNQCREHGCARWRCDEDHIDGVPQIDTTPLELDLTAQAATGALRRALHVYAKATSRPRKAGCWAFVQCELWNARQDALRSGALVRGSEEHKLVTARYTDATHRLETARAMERAGHADARV